MIKTSKQQWDIGQTVTVGFVTGLIVVEKVATPGDYQPDAYILERNGQRYAFVPHKGIRKLAPNERAFY